MKKIILTLCVLLSISCKAQIIEDVLHRTGDNQTGAYYKDLNNILTPFVGTYIYTNGSTTFKIELRKKLHSSVNGRYFEDMLIGAYEYKENNIINANTFNHLNSNNFADGTWNKLYARIFFTGDWSGCDECSTDPNNIWIRASIHSITNPWVNEMRFKKIVYNGQEALRVIIRGMGAVGRKEGDPLPVIQPFSYPCCGTEFVMIKQP